jgi:glycosyltransferase involved in cell wall biosynthesis
MTTPPGPTVYFVVPDSIDDALRVSGGNVYDRHVRDGLRSAGWDVRMLAVPETADSASALADVPDEALVLIDGLIAVRESHTVTATASRLRMIVLAHMVASLLPAHDADPTGLAELVDRERSTLRSAHRVITTSDWTRSNLVEHELADCGDIVVAHPGTLSAPATVPSTSGGRLLCVGVVAPHKGQDILVDALATLTDIDGWTCTFAGSLATARTFIDGLTDAVARGSLTARVNFTGPLAGPDLEAAYGTADLVVVPSRIESYGMVVAEALARGIPVLVADVGGIREALSGGGAAPAGASTAGLIVPADDPVALEAALRVWLSNPLLRDELAARARAASARVRRWSATIAVIESVLHEVAHTRTVVAA